jgi:cell division protein FtsB
MMEEVELLKKDIAELQKCFYKVLKRNVELFEKVTKLEEETVDLRRTTTTKSDFSEKMDRD